MLSVCRLKIFVSFVLFVDKPLFKTAVHEKHKKHEQKQKIKADFVRCVGRAATLFGNPTFGGDKCWDGKAPAQRRLHPIPMDVG